MAKASKQKIKTGVVLLIKYGNELGLAPGNILIIYVDKKDGTVQYLRCLSDGIPFGGKHYGSHESSLDKLKEGMSKEQIYVYGEVEFKRA